MFSNLVLSGGSVKGLAYIGALKFLEEKGLIKNVHNFIGASCGSLVCFLYAMHLSLDEIIDSCYTLMRNYENRVVDPECIFDINQTLGLDDGSFFVSWLSDCLYMKYGIRDISFIEFAKKTGNNLVICVSNLSKCRPEYFCVDRTPDVSVLTAIQASISIPLIFMPVRIGEDLFVDAGVFNNFPIDFIKDYRLKDTLGISIHTRVFHVQEPLNLFSFLSLIMNSVLERVNNKDKDFQGVKVITMDFSQDEEDTFLNFSFDDLKLKMNASCVEEYIKKGYEDSQRQLI